MISLTIGRRKEVILPVCRWANSFRYSRFLKRKAIIIIIAFRFRNLSSSSFLLLYVRLVCCCPSVLFEVCLLILLLRFYFPSEVFVSDSFVNQGTNRDSKEISHCSFRWRIETFDSKEYQKGKSRSDRIDREKTSKIVGKSGHGYVPETKIHISKQKIRRSSYDDNRD